MKTLPYEKQVFSQHEEDGIIETLIDNLINPNNIAIEIGSGDGRQNMLRNLVVNKNYLGIGHDVLPARFIHKNYNHNQGFINLNKLENLIEIWPTHTPDFFSLDIDSFDFWILKDLIKKFSFRPSIICVEYLSYYGPNLLISAKPNLERYTIDKCGASLNLFKTFLKKNGYEFFTCDSTGVNAFFYDDKMINSEIKNLPYHQWTFFKKYKKYVRKDFNDPELEINTEILLQ